MVYRKLRTLGNYVSMIRNRDRWPTKDLDSCISHLAAPGIGVSLESFSLTLVDVDLEEGGLVGPIPIVALVSEVYDDESSFPYLPCSPQNRLKIAKNKVAKTPPHRPCRKHASPPCPKKLRQNYYAFFHAIISLKK
jgi:hypothetical protein